LGFDIAKFCLASSLKNLGDTLLEKLFDRRIGIDKSIAQTIGKEFTNCTLARTHHPDRVDIDSL
jgi:hypothetical protein